MTGRMQLMIALLGLGASVYAAPVIIEVDTHANWNKLMKHHATKTGLPIIADFYSDSCGPCRMIAPAYKRIAKQYKGRAVFVKVNVNNNQQTSQARRVRSMPTFQFFLKGKQTHEFAGADERQLMEITDKLVRKATALNQEINATVLEAYYQKHDPKKVPLVPQILAKYPAHKLVKMLKTKYGEAPKTQRKKFKSGKAKAPKIELKANLQLATPEELKKELEKRTAEAEEDEEEEMFAGRPVAGKVEKVTIIGAGPSGLSAATYAARAGLKPVVVAPMVGGQLMGKGVDVENYPGMMHQTGPKIVKLMRKQAYSFGTIFENKMVVAVDLQARPFTVTTNDTMGNTATFKTHALILSTGADSNWLNVPGEHAYRGGGVSSCATCDGFLFKDKPVIVIGGGDTAMEDALVLARTSSKVTVLHRRDSFRASKIMAQRVLDHPKVEVKWNTNVVEFKGKEEEGKAMLTHAAIKTNGVDAKVDCDAAFVAIGHSPNTKMFKGQLDMDKTGYILTKGMSSKTSVEGVFGAGDVADHVYRQAITSAGTGAMAALDAERWLSEEGIEDDNSGAEATPVAAEAKEL